MEYLKIESEPEVRIDSYVIDNGEVVWFKINVKIDDREWSVSHRYNEFDELHAKLKKIGSNGVGQGSFEVKLPPKKFRPNQDFLEKRKEELCEYIKNLFEFYQRNIPTKLADFLFFYKYQPNGLVLQLYQFLKKVGTLIGTLKLKLILE